MPEAIDIIMIMSSIITLKDFLKDLDDSALLAVSAAHPHLKEKREAVLGAIKTLEENLKENFNVKISLIPPSLFGCTNRRQLLEFHPIPPNKYQN